MSVLIHLFPRHRHRAWWRRLYARHEATLLASGAGLGIFAMIVALAYAAFGGWR